MSIKFPNSGISFKYDQGSTFFNNIFLSTSIQNLFESILWTFRFLWVIRDVTNNIFANNFSQPIVQVPFWNWNPLKYHRTVWEASSLITKLQKYVSNLYRNCLKFDAFSILVIVITKKLLLFAITPKGILNIKYFVMILF